MARVYLDVDTRRLRYRYQPQADPILLAQQAAFRAGAHIADTKQPIEVECGTVGNELLLRGIPIVGKVGGTIRGTRPGDSTRWLED